MSDATTRLEQATDHLDRIRTTLDDAHRVLVAADNASAAAQRIGVIVRTAMIGVVGTVALAIMLRGALKHRP